MGQLEQKSKARQKRKNVQKFVLGAVATAGALSVAAVAPNALGAMIKLGLVPTKRQKEVINMSRDRLLKKGWLAKDKKGFLTLTERGQRALSKMHALEHGIATPRRWDGKWRILIFDFPQRRGALRNKVRDSLRAVGFILLQKSVWVYPYDCEDFVALLKADFKIGKDMLYLIVDTIENDTKLRQHFGLRKR